MWYIFKMYYIFYISTFSLFKFIPKKARGLELLAITQQSPEQNLVLSQDRTISYFKSALPRRLSFKNKESYFPNNIYYVRNTNFRIKTYKTEH